MCQRKWDLRVLKYNLLSNQNRVSRIFCKENLVKSKIKNGGMILFFFLAGNSKWNWPRKRFSHSISRNMSSIRKTFLLIILLLITWLKTTTTSPRDEMRYCISRRTPALYKPVLLHVFINNWLVQKDLHSCSTVHFENKIRKESCMNSYKIMK